MPATWTPERRATQAERMRAKWADGTFARLVVTRRPLPSAWNWAELETLRRYAGREPLWRLTELVNEKSLHQRTQKAVSVKLDTLGLSRWMPVEQGTLRVARLLGRHPVTIRKWIGRGWIQARRVGSGRARRGTDYLIERAAVDALLRARPWLIDPSDIRDPSWRALVEVERRVQQRQRGRAA